ncbi:hypothetical protein GUITHDRAFT_132691 [Guillardia theta CCMP2712]|uniref:Acid phosphatase n=1 Tax=Guillardia theta (strain CCMP2712) TaxID=905079 RepID=L1JZF3_GUITC|nr:hypothetical protein GUITHDRAFT_132691 [Guillardia theta CCMP2712]EKX53585.1 hypothetical protein GUITHDRAFT_132691 [Guillardia theta CCMP2712]|eukprot:XP_005840565.1 hypothetical protein GUITHDRAFT_132691 [Guillardia theta CCMP2712]
MIALKSTHRAAALTTLLLLPSILCKQELVQIQVITRHGARTALPKTKKLLEGGSALTPLGEKQHYDLGLWLRKRYISSKDDPLRLSKFDYTKVYLMSSEFDRTMVSATSLLTGLFPEDSRNNDVMGYSLLPAGTPRANIPLHVKENGRDITIRAYDKCPSFVQDLQRFYETPEFRTRQQEHKDSGLLYKVAKSATLQKYAEADEDGRHFIPLTEIWNAFDEINVAKTECSDDAAGSGTCKALTEPSLQNLLSESEWLELKKLAFWVEAKKYGRENAGSRLGNIMLDILRRMGPVLKDGEIVTTKTPEELDSFVLYSAHYATILGALAALDVSAFNGDFLKDRIPEYAAALIFELYFDSETKSYSVQVLFKDGGKESAEYLALQEDCGKTGPCPLQVLVKRLQQMGYDDDLGWCRVCSNSDSETCQLGRYRSTPYSAHIAAAALSSSAGVILLFCLLSLLRRRYNRYLNDRRAKALDSSQLETLELKSHKRAEPEDRSQVQATSTTPSYDVA